MARHLTEAAGRDLAARDGKSVTKCRLMRLLLLSVYLSVCLSRLHRLKAAL